MNIVPIVEGQGDVKAIPILIRRFSDQFERSVVVSSPIRCPKNKIIRGDQVVEKELERVLRLAKNKLEQPGGILLLMDADLDCPATIAPKLLSISKSILPGVRIKVILPVREYESWFLASIQSLGGRRGISQGVSLPADLERISGAKECLQTCMGPGRYYSETLEQPALTSLFDLTEARKNSPSFDKFWRDIEDLICNA